MSGNHAKYFTPILALAFWIITSSSFATAAVKDTDIDGLTDTAEMSIYSTDPNNHDSDGDGASDGNEIIDNTDPLDPESNLLALKENSDTKTWRIIGIYSGSVLIIFGIVATYIFLSTKKPASRPASSPEQIL